VRLSEVMSVLPPVAPIRSYVSVGRERMPGRSVRLNTTRTQFNLPSYKAYG
jgi:hypothetical protein